MTFVLYDLFSLHLWEELFFLRIFEIFPHFGPHEAMMRAKFWVTTVCICLKVLKMNSVWSKMGRYFRGYINFGDFAHFELPRGKILSNHNLEMPESLKNELCVVKYG